MIETERLILRQWREEDRAPFAALCADPEVMRHFPAPLDRAEADALIDRQIAAIHREGFGLWTVERKADGAFIGFTGLARVALETPVEGEIEIGWRLARDHWRQGYATEAARAALEWFWANRSEPRIVAFTIPANRPSWGVMEKIGMVRTPELDFGHPRFEPGSRCHAHIVYVKDRPA